jgi:cytochrome c553
MFPTRSVQITAAAAKITNVSRTIEAAVLKYFVDPLDDDDIAAIARIWEKLQAAQASLQPAATR